MNFNIMVVEGQVWCIGVGYFYLVYVCILNGDIIKLVGVVVESGIYIVVLVLQVIIVVNVCIYV